MTASAVGFLGSSSGGSASAIWTPEDDVVPSPQISAIGSR